MTTYCPIHQRAQIPEGFDLRQRRAIPMKWVPLRQMMLAFAHGVLVAGGCAVPEVQLKRCDLCDMESLSNGD